MFGTVCVSRLSTLVQYTHTYMYVLCMHLHVTCDQLVLSTLWTRQTRPNGRAVCLHTLVAVVDKCFLSPTSLSLLVLMITVAAVVAVVTAGDLPRCKTKQKNKKQKWWIQMRVWVLRQFIHIYAVRTRRYDALIKSIRKRLPVHRDFIFYRKNILITNKLSLSKQAIIIFIIIQYTHGFPISARRPK